MLGVCQELYVCEACSFLIFSTSQRSETLIVRFSKEDVEAGGNWCRVSNLTAGRVPGSEQAPALQLHLSPDVFTAPAAN